MGKFQIALISLILLLGLSLEASGPCAPGLDLTNSYINGKIQSQCLSPEEASANYGYETENNIDKRLNQRVGDEEAALGNANSAAIDAMSVGPCSEAYKEMKESCDQVNDKVVMAMMVQQLSGASASASGNAKVAAGAQSAGALASAQSTVSIGVSCYNAAVECSSVCEPIAKEGQRKIASKQKPLPDEKAAIKNVGQCGARKTSILAQMGGSLTSVMAALANAAQAMKAVNTQPAVAPPPGYEVPPFVIPSSGGPDFGTGPGSSGDTQGHEYLGNIDSGKQASQYGSNEAAGSGGGISGGAYPGGAPAGQGGGAAPSGFKDPGGGLSGGGGYSVTGVPFGGGGGGGNYGGGRGDRGGSEKLDLSKFLPGGEMDPTKRGLASVEKALQGQGITGANDLSNFEKVSRMMNKKRGALKP